MGGSGLQVNRNLSEPECKTLRVRERETPSNEVEKERMRISKRDTLLEVRKGERL